MNCSFNHYQILQKEISTSTKLHNNFPKVFGTKPYGDELNSITSVTVVLWLEWRTNNLGVPGLICISVSTGSCLLYLLHNNGKIIVSFLPSNGPCPSLSFCVKLHKSSLHQ